MEDKERVIEIAIERLRDFKEHKFYARDTSRKIRSVFKTKGMSGKHLTGIFLVTGSFFVLL